MNLRPLWMTALDLPMNGTSKIRHGWSGDLGCALCLPEEKNNLKYLLYTIFREQGTIAFIYVFTNDDPKLQCIILLHWSHRWP